MKRFRLKGLLALSAALIFAPLAVQAANMDLHHEVSLEGQTDNLAVFGLTHNNIKDTNFSGSLLVMHDTKHNNTSPGAGFRYNFQWMDEVPLYTTLGFATFLLDDKYQNTPNGQVRLGLDYIYQFNNNHSGLKFGLGVTKNFTSNEEARDYGGYFSVSWMSNNRHHR